MQAKDNNIYGTTYLGGTMDMPFTNLFGSLFKLTISNDNLVTDYIYDIPSNVTGGNEGPIADLIQDDDGNFYGMLYGDTLINVTTHGGLIYKKTPEGLISKLHEFKFADSAANGVHPNGRLLLAKDGFLYGITEHGGANGTGTIFKISTTGSDFEVVRSFEAGGSFPVHPTDGGVRWDPYANPYSGLIQATDGNLYGVAKYGGGPQDAGRIFKVTLPEGTLSTHFSFTQENRYPIFELVQLSDGKLYGTALGDGTKNKGIIFRIGLQEQAPLEILHSFAGQIPNGDGDLPSTRLVMGNDGNLYVGTRFGGSGNKGAIVKFGRK